MRLVIAGHYGFANAGDEAILAVMLADLRARLPEASFTVLSGDPAATTAAHGVSAVKFTAVVAVMDALRGADLLVLGGGGLFRDYWGVKKDTLLSQWHGGLSFYCGMPLMAALVSTPTVIYGAGVGPLLSEEGRLFTRYAFEQSSAATVRDETSRTQLAAAGADTSRVTVGADPAILIRPDSSDAVRARIAGLARPIVGVALRAWDVGVDPERWEREVARGLDRVLARRGGTALFVPFQVLPRVGADDVDIARGVAAQMLGKSVLVPGGLSPAETAALVAECDVVVGMRLHSIVFAARAGVPAAAIVHDIKVRSFVEEAALASYASDIEALANEELASRIERALDDAAGLRPALLSHAQSLAARAQANGAAVANLLARGAGLPPDPADTVGMLKRAATGLMIGGAERVGGLSRRLTELTKDLQSRARDIEWLQEEARKRDEEARLREAGIMAQVEERDRGIAWLREQAEERDRGIAWLREQAEVRDHEIARLREQVEERDRGIAWLREQVEEGDRGIAWLRDEVSLRERKLEAIYASRLWQFGLRYWRARGRVETLLRRH